MTQARPCEHALPLYTADCYLFLIYVGILWWGAEISTIRFSNSKMLPQENWQAGCKWDDTRPLLCMTNTWLLKTVSARCFIKNMERKHRTARFFLEWIEGEKKRTRWKRNKRNYWPHWAFDRLRQTEPHRERRIKESFIHNKQDYMRKCCYDLLKKHFGDLLYKAHLPKRERERERARKLSVQKPWLLS